MQKEDCRLARGLLLRFAVALVLVSAGNPSLHAQSSSQNDPVLQAWRGHREIFACQQCHGRSAAVGIASTEGLQPGDFSRQNELHQWVRNDKHAIARTRIEPLSPAQVAAERDKLLAEFTFADPSLVEQWVGPSNELSLRICETLGWKMTSDDGYSLFAQSCLNCHGGYRGTPADQEAFSRPTNLANRQPGISCIYCHQTETARGELPGEQPEWVLKHASLGDPQTSWRIKQPVEKARLGMADLVDTGQQASLCMDCHVGNLERKMFVSHDMYAAGHPPLPSFELDTFCESMPQHWRSSGELNKALTASAYPEREIYYAINFPQLARALTAEDIPVSDVFWKTRQMLIGAVVAHRRSAQLIATAADNQGRWGDYALYDCAACHHELRRPSRRQQRGYPGPPGRPRLPEWPQALFAIALEVAGEQLAEQVSMEEQQLAGTVAAVPFGDPAHCGPAAKALISGLDKVLDRVESEPVTAPNALAVIQRLSGISDDELIEYSAARQVAWAILVATDELAAAGYQLPAEVAVEIDGWRGKTDGPSDQMSADSVGIAMGLPSTRGAFIYPKNLRSELQRRSEYEESRLVVSLKRIHQALADYQLHK